MAGRNWCLNCFQIKGNYEVCPHCGYMENAEPENLYQLKPGTILRGRYIIGASIGLGGFGITYKAYDVTLGMVVAVKEFYPAGLVNRAEGEKKVGVFSGEKAQTYEKWKKRFLEEAQNMAIFARDRDIVNEYDFFEENGTAYIIMEFIHGRLLKEQLRETGKFPLETACGYMMSILNALKRIHENGIIHRDISPDNIFLLENGRVKIFDFGAAYFQRGVEEQLPSLIVKAGYAPPEQYRTKGQVGTELDIYGAGAVFYEMVTGEKPIESLDRMMGEKLKTPTELGIEMDPVIEGVMLKALSLQPEDRFHSGEEFEKAMLKETDSPGEKSGKTAMEETVSAGEEVGKTAMEESVSAGENFGKPEREKRLPFWRRKRS